MTFDIFAEQMQMLKIQPDDNQVRALVTLARQEETLRLLVAKGNSPSLPLRRSPHPNSPKMTAEDFRTLWAKELQRIRDEDYQRWDELAIPKGKQLDEILKVLPTGSWAIQFTFTLATPYLSKGIEAFDLLDNPIIRDKVYGVPIVPASSWKGGLRAAAVMHLFDGGLGMFEEVVEAAKKQPEKIWDIRLQQLTRLFGNERSVSDTFRAGRLHCFPSGFQATRCEIINPHNRARRVGKNPILLECVPSEQSGIFTLLYIATSGANQNDCADDPTLCSHAIHDLLLEWGIGAKKSNGNGLAKDEVMSLYLGPQKQAAEIPEPQLPALPEVCGSYEERFGTDYQTVKPKVWHPHDGADSNTFRAARDAYQEHKRRLEAYPGELEAWKQRPKEEVAIIAKASLTQLAELVKIQVIPVLKEGQL